MMMISATRPLCLRGFLHLHILLCLLRLRVWCGGGGRGPARARLAEGRQDQRHHHHVIDGHGMVSLYIPRWFLLQPACKEMPLGALQGAQRALVNFSTQKCVIIETFLGPVRNYVLHYFHTIPGTFR